MNFDVLSDSWPPILLSISAKWRLKVLTAITARLIRVSGIKVRISLKVFFTSWHLKQIGYTDTESYLHGFFCHISPFTLRESKALLSFTSLSCLKHKSYSRTLNLMLMAETSELNFIFCWVNNISRCFLILNINEQKLFIVVVLASRN